jgi:hypothetical protein
MEIVVFTVGVVEVLSSFLLRFGSVWQAMVVWNLMVLRRRWGGYTVN